jgi:hypothetical protein
MPAQKKKEIHSMKTKIRKSVSRWRRLTAAEFLIPLLLTCFAFMQNAQATEPDTILPNGNTA